MKAAIITDSTASLSEALLKHPDIYQVNLTVRFNDGMVFTDSNDEEELHRFYEKLRESKTLPQTSQPAPEQYLTLYSKFIEAGYDTVFVLTLSSKISGTYQTAVMMGEDMADKITTHVIDSKGTSYLIESMAQQLLSCLEQGDDVATIIEKMHWIVAHSVIYISLEDLDHIVKGGRLNALQATFGKAFHIQPILYFNQEGTVEVFEKVRSERRLLERWKALVAEAVDQFPNGIEIKLAHADNAAFMERVMTDLKSSYPDLDYRVGFLTPVLGTYAGPGALGMGIIAKVGRDTLLD